ncbi:hypothetical protein [Chthonobacter rhizosphaerae]|uniref:hypothetical protein n=1 Tax=Chthonobacter rhizosphaerae TaxID=2735553 RepID=UPI0015EF506B|nr:hypothetical protein [Chthonobacter rhizosphaerae]
MRAWTAALIGCTCLVAASPAAAQWWNPFDEGPDYREPPVIYEEPPPVYAPPPGYYEAPPPGYGPPPGLSNRRPLPPADVPYSDELDARGIEPGYGRDRDLPSGRYIVRPDEGDLPPEDYGYPDADGRTGDPYADDDVYGREEPYGQRLEDAGRPAEPDTRRSQAFSYDALDALARYAPAKKAAVALNDAFRKAAAIRTANTFLISVSARPATGATVRTVDRLLGIDVSDAATTALPPAGTQVERPEAGDLDPAADEAIRRIEDYARDKSDAAAARDDAAAKAAEARLAEAVAGGLDAVAIAGLDAYLGLGEDPALVEAPTPERDERIVR